MSLPFPADKSQLSLDRTQSDVECFRDFRVAESLQPLEGDRPFELVWQLRGQADKRQVDGAKIALQHNLGLGGAAVVTMYKKADIA